MCICCRIITILTLREEVVQISKKRNVDAGFDVIVWGSQNYRFVFSYKEQ